MPTAGQFDRVDQRFDRLENQMRTEFDQTAAGMAQIVELLTPPPTTRSSPGGPRGLAMARRGRPTGATGSVLGRALRLLDAFGPSRPVMTLSQIARHAGLPLSTAHRLLAELVSWAPWSGTSAAATASACD